MSKIFSKRNIVIALVIIVVIGLAVFIIGKIEPRYKEHEVTAELCEKLVQNRYGRDVDVECLQIISNDGAIVVGYILNDHIYSFLIFGEEHGYEGVFTLDESSLRSHPKERANDIYGSPIYSGPRHTYAVLNANEDLRYIKIMHYDGEIEMIDVTECPSLHFVTGKEKPVPEGENNSGSYTWGFLFLDKDMNEIR